LICYDEFSRSKLTKCKRARPRHWTGIRMTRLNYNARVRQTSQGQGDQAGLGLERQLVRILRSKAFGVDCLE